LFLLSLTCALQNKKVKRTIDLQTQLARHTIEINLYNDGPEKVETYYITIPTSLSSKLSYIQVYTQENPNIPIFKKGETETVNGIEYNVYAVTFPSPLEKGKERNIVIYLVFIHSMSVYPEEITQSERQLVKYLDNHYFFSPYPTVEVVTTVRLASSSVQSHIENSPNIVRGDQIQYGTYKDHAPFAFSQMSIHFENNRPFITVSKFVRLIELSHWGGNIAVEDHVMLVHTGARLKGPFSRYDYQINPQANGQAALKFLRQYLPSEALDVYYRDDIGNISTSHLNVDDDNKLRLDLRPRFPLFGGWQTEYYMGYNLPSESYLFYDSNSGNYIINTTLIPNWEVGLSIDYAEVRVILPEGASDPHIKSAPFAVETDTGKHVTYLDYNGRPVFIIKKDNLVNEHYQFFLISYNFSSISGLQEPLLLIAGFFVVFMIIIFVRRFDLTIEE